MDADRPGTARQQRGCGWQQHEPQSLGSLALPWCLWVLYKKEKTLLRYLGTGRNLPLCVTAPGSCASREQGCSNMRLALPTLPRGSLCAACPLSPSSLLLPPSMSPFLSPSP